MDAGSDDGLVVGMRLFVSGEERLAARSGRIEEVEGRRATLALDALHEERDLAAQLVGRRASTLHSGAERP